MDICLFNRLFKRFHGGIETYTYRLAGALAGRGHTVHIICERGPLEYDFGEFKDAIHVHVFDYQPRIFKGYWRINQLIPLAAIDYHLHMKRIVNQLAQQWHFDVMEIPDFEGFRPIGRKICPVVVRLHGFHGMLEKFTGPYWKRMPSQIWVKQWIRLWADSAEGISGVTESYLTIFKNIFKISNKRISVCFLSVDPKLFCPRPDISREKETVLFVGRMEKTKGIDALLAAVPLIAERFPQVSFVLIGRDKKYKDTGQMYGEYIKENFSKYNLKFLGQRPPQEVADYYRRATLAVFPSLFEPGGTVAIEAVSCGCPVIVSAVGGFKEYFENMVNAVVVPPDDHAALAEGVIKLIQDEKSREDLRRNAGRLLEDKFDFEKIIDQTVAIYQKAMDEFKGEGRGNEDRR
ncbi:MAG: glycosyltransferase family 4 protein [Candidatus Omnitrophota bacterium]